jgi:hypothetical protein
MTLAALLVALVGCPAGVLVALVGCPAAIAIDLPFLGLGFRYAFD